MMDDNTKQFVKAALLGLALVAAAWALARLMGQVTEEPKHEPTVKLVREPKPATRHRDPSPPAIEPAEPGVTLPPAGLADIAPVAPEPASGGEPGA